MIYGFGLDSVRNRKLKSSAAKKATDEVSLAEMLEIQDQEVVVEFKGKLVGDELKLHRKVVDIAEYDIVAKRVKEPAKK